MLQCNIADCAAARNPQKELDMAWSREFPSVEAVEAGAARAFRLPMGVASPLWAVFAAAAGVGVAYWWMTRWTRAVNVEALAAAAPKPLAAPEPAEIVAEAAVAVEETVEAVADPIAVESPTIEPEVADDLTQMTGIGPKLSLALSERGVTRFAQIAAWTADDLASFDAALALKGRAVREAWVAQAKRLATHA
jgi:predicted flap endonuclease-1-like 5' DNA nuclease